MGLTILKLILGVSAIALLSHEYKQIKYMDYYLILVMFTTAEYLASIILQYIMINGKTERRTPESNCEFIIIAWWSLNVILLFVFFGLILHNVIVDSIWTLNYYLAFFFLAIMIM